jgi:hypothetical protein
LSDAPAGVGYWVLAAAVVSGAMATIVLTTKVARVNEATDSGELVAEEKPNVTPIRRNFG